MESRPTAPMKKKQHKPGDYEDVYFKLLIGSLVMLEDWSGKQFGGKLFWVGPYSLIVEREGTRILYWKHSLKSIWAVK